MCIYSLLLFSTDPTLTHANISTVTATVTLQGDELGSEILLVPRSKRKEIHQQSSSAAEERATLIHYYLNYSEYASWSDLAGRLYCRQHRDALSAARRFIKTEPGEFMCNDLYLTHHTLCTLVLFTSARIHELKDGGAKKY